MDGFHVKSMTENEVDALPCTQVGKPVPGKHALHGDGEVVAERSDGFQENIRIRRQVSMKKDFSFLTKRS